MILQKHTEKELLAMIAKLQQQVDAVSYNSKIMVEKLNAMQSELDKKPNIVIKETIKKEIEKPTITEITIIKTDPSVLPTIKKLSGRLKVLEDKAPAKQIIKEMTTHEVKSVDSVSKKELSDIKKSISEIKPVVNNVNKGVTSADVLSLIAKHVTIDYVNKLYKKGTK